MIEGVDEKDEAKLLTMIDAKVRTTFGEGGGIDEFRRSWKTSSPASPLWVELGAVLRLGGSFRGEGAQRSFWAPYVYSAWPDAIDAFQNVAAVRAGVAVRKAPSEDAPQVATVDWEILELLLRRATVSTMGSGKPHHARL